MPNARRYAFLFESQESLKALGELVDGMQSIPDGAARARWIHGLLDGTIAKDREESPEFWSQVKCKKSCSACCHQRVEVTKDEGALLREVAKTVTPDQRLVDLQKDITDTDEHYLLGHGNNDCAFLDAKNGQCRIYEYRPIACRSYFVFTPPEKCAPTPGADLREDLKKKEVGVLTYQMMDAIVAAAFIASDGNYPSIAAALEDK